jgi:excisionase family DNA binding protein
VNATAIPPENANTPEPDELLTVPQAARWAGVSRATVGHWIRGGLLPTTRRGRRHLIRTADLAAVQEAAHVGMVVPVWRADGERVAQRLRALREAAGLSQLALGAVAGLTHEAISRLETGERTAAPETVRRLARALRVKPERFIAYDEIGLSMLTSAEAAARLDVPTARVATWLRNGVLAGTKVSGQWRVPAIAVSELERSGRLRGQSRRLDPRYRG